MSKPTPRSAACFPLAFSCEQRWGRRRTGARSVGERTDSARRAQLLDEVREAERASRMVPEGRDGGADPLQCLGAECPLDLLEASLLRLPLARTPRRRHGIRVGDAVLSQRSERLRLALRTRSHVPRVAARADAFQVHGVVAWRARCSGPGERPTARSQGGTRLCPEKNVTVE